MTVQTCYEKLHGDYDDAKQRLMTDKLIEKFMLMFPADTSMEQLRKAAAENDNEAAFAAAHTLKGVAGNLSFTELAAAASDLTEQLRPRSADPDPELLQKVEAAYQLTINALQEYSSEKE